MLEVGPPRPAALLRLSWAALGRLYGLEQDSGFWAASHAINN